MIAQQAWALGEVAVNYSRAVMGAVASAAGIPFPGNVLAFAKSIAIPTIQAAAAVANIRAQKFDAPAFADGGFTGSGDGPAGYVNSPTLFQMGKRQYIAGEAGREFVISNRALSNPVVADFARMMDVARKTGNYSQLMAGASGGSTANDYSSGAFGIGSDTKQTVGMSPEMGMAILSELQQNRAAMEKYANRPIIQNYRLRQQFDDNIQEARDANKL